MKIISKMERVPGLRAIKTAILMELLLRMGIGKVYLFDKSNKENEYPANPYRTLYEIFDTFAALVRNVLLPPELIRDAGIDFEWYSKEYGKKWRN